MEALITCFRTIPVIHELHIQLFDCLKTRIQAAEEEEAENTTTINNNSNTNNNNSNTNTNNNNINVHKQHEPDDGGGGVGGGGGFVEPYSAVVGAVFLEFAPLFALYETFVVHYYKARAALLGTEFCATFVESCGSHAVETMQTFLAHVQVRLPTYTIMLSRLLHALPTPTREKSPLVQAVTRLTAGMYYIHTLLSFFCFF
jgi:hypothetical protein